HERPGVVAGGSGMNTSGITRTRPRARTKPMLAHGYSYDACLRGSVTRAWTVDDCFRGRDFDFSKRFLPERIAGVDHIGCLDEDEKRMLNQIRGNSYCHVFAFVEEYIVPLVMDRARAEVYGHEPRLWCL